MTVSSTLTIKLLVSLSLALIITIGQPGEGQKTPRSGQSSSPFHLPSLVNYGEALLSRYPDRIRAAEAEGLRRASRTHADHKPRRCVDATGRDESGRGVGIYSSGEFRAGGFGTYAATWHQGFGKLWWAPDNPSEADTLIVTGTRLDSTYSPYEFRADHLVRASGSQKLFYASGVRVPVPGVWLFIAVAGKNWGCFLFAFE